MVFPCNQFNQQEKGNNQEIREFYKKNYQVSFPIMAKTEVNGPNEEPLYTFLKKKKGGLFGSKIKWNFSKFLVNRQGQVIKRYSPQVSPEVIEKDILALL